MTAPKTIGQYMLRRVIPEDLQDGSVLNKKNAKKLFQNLAEKHPEQYIDVQKDLVDIGRESATYYGRDASLGLRDLLPPPEVEKAMDRLRLRVNMIAQDPKLASKEKGQKIESLIRDNMNRLRDEMMEEGVTNRNALVQQAYHGFRSDPLQISQILIGDFLVADQNGKPIPLPGLHGYGGGVKAHEYLAGSYGARSGYYAVQFATAQSGYLGKLMANMAQRLRITGDDCGAAQVGFTTSGDDPDVIGSVLAEDVGEHKAGTAITKQMLPDLADKEIRIRSLLTCQQPEGVCKLCAGKRENGQFPKDGAFVGITSASVLSEPLTQTLGLCLAADTEVRMGDMSVKRIDEITVGDVVMGADTQGRLSPVQVTSVFNNGLRDVHRYTFQGSAKSETRTLDCTPAHKILAAYKDSNLKRLVRGVKMEVGSKKHRFAAVIPSGMVQGGTYEEPDAFLLGMLIGDGGCSKGVHQVALSSSEPEVIEELQARYADRGIRFTPNSPGKYMVSWARNCELPGRAEQNPIKQKLIDYGLWGKYSYEKHLPIGWENWSLHSLQELVGGLLSSDGHIGSQKHVPNIQYACTSKRLVEELQTLLFWWFGIAVPDPYEQSNTRGFGGADSKTMHRIDITRATMICRCLDLFPLIGKRRQTGATLKTRCISRTRQPAALWKRVSSISLGTMPTYDIEVANEDHLFVLANGMIVSNSAKHSGGSVGRTDTYGAGLKAVGQFMSVPDNFQGAAALAPIDGAVTGIQNAPQGGKYIFVGDARTYVPEGYQVTAEIGKRVEAGDVLSEGIPNPREIAMHKGLGEGRLYYTKQFGQILKNSGLSAKRRDLEAIGRGMMDRVRITADEGVLEYLPGDVVPYSQLSQYYQARQDAKTDKPSRLKNHYLEQPVLHYTIGTRLAPSVIKRLESAGIDNVVAHEQGPGFEPEVVRAVSVPMSDPDWRTRLGAFHLKSSFLESARKGSSSANESTSYVPMLMNPTLIPS